MSADRVFTVRSTPDLSRFERREPVESLRKGRRFVAGYVGVMGAQDGVDLLIRAMADLVRVRGREDIQCVLVGRGTEIPRLKALADELGIADYVTFAGYLDPEAFFETLSTFDLGVVPDPKNPFNDKCSMNKVFEYMALGIPIVGFDLIETHRSAGDAALYARDNNPAELAARIACLCDVPELRRQLGDEGRMRAATQMDWKREERALLDAYEKAFEGAGARPRAPVIGQPMPAG